jgi:hypothetical protein
MKRFFVLMTAVALFLSVVCAAVAQTFTTAYFSMELPDGWEIDTEDLEKKEGEESLGFFGGKMGDGLLVGGAYLVYYEDLKDISLWNAGEEELKEYTNILLEEFADSKPEAIGTVMAGKIPLVLIRGADKEGEFVYADTVTNGYSIQFEFYATETEGDKELPLTDEHIEQIKTILASFKPAA